MLTSSPGAEALQKDPYPHYATPDALEDYASLCRDFPAEDTFAGSIRMHGDLTSGDEGYADLLARSQAYRALHQWVYSTSFVATFLDLFDDDIDERVRAGDLLYDPRDLKISPDPVEGRDLLGVNNLYDTEPFLFPRMDIGIGRLDYGKVNGGRGIHVDNLTRLVSILVYIDDNDTMVGGEHRLYRLEDFRPVISKVYKPEGNLMVASLQTNEALHDVNPITAIEGVRKAIYMAVSCSAEIWRPSTDKRIQRLGKSRYKASLGERAMRKIWRKLGGAGQG